MNSNIVIIGAGLVGPLLALTLTKKGYKVAVYERYEDIRHIPSLGRSINLVLTSRGLRAVSAIDKSGLLLNEMLEIARPVVGRVIHHENGEVDFQRYGKDDNEFNHSISRYELNKFFINKAEEVGAKFYFNHTLIDLDMNMKFPVLTFKKGEENVIVHSFGPVLACDGGGSITRRILRQQNRLDFVEVKCPQGYKELMFPRGNSLSMKGLHIWPRGDHFLMALENLDGSFTGTIYINTDGPESFKELKNKEKVETFFKKYYSHAIAELGGIEKIFQQMLNNPVGFLGTLKTNHFNIGGKICLLGDSGHAITPFFGQGTNASFEDCFDFVEMMDKFASQEKMTVHGLAAAFTGFNQKRKSNSDAIADMALENFIEMRSKVGDKKFLLMKRVENLIEKKFEHLFRSRYAMVCYGGNGNITYQNAKTLGDVQWEIVEQLSIGLTNPEDVNFQDALQMIEQSLVPLQKLLGVNIGKISHFH